jgi:ribosome-associated protein
MATTDKTLVQKMLAAAALACDERKAEDIRILALDPAESGLTDYFLIATGNSDRQNVAITDAVELKLKHDFGAYPNSVEGRRQGEWILMDYVDFIVHVFNPEKRAFYGLERLRKSATVLSIDDLNAQLKTQIVKASITTAVVPARKKSPAKKKPITAKKPTPKKLSAKSIAKKSPTKTVAKKSPAESPARKATKKK